MDFWCVTPKQNTHLRCDNVNGIFGDRVRGSLKKSLWVHDETKKSTEKKRVNKPKPGLAFAVLTSNNTTTKEALTVKVGQFHRRKAEAKNVAAIILGGGTGADLFPLTTRTATPAVPVGGCYRIIDIPMSNCINSGVNKIFVLTQFNSASLNRHVARTYYGNGGINFGDGFVEILAANQTNGKDGMQWFQGTADAVRQFTWVFEDAKHRNIENVVVLSGDHLYRMDYMKFVQSHVDNNADITISCAPVNESRASDYGLVKIDSRGQIFHFNEKPKGVNLKAMQTDTSLLGLSKQDSMKFPYVASMGVYVFKTDILLKLLRWRYPASNDFGSEIIPEAVKDYDVHAYMFREYWEDIGTIKTFYEASLGLTDEVPKFEFYDPQTPFFTSPRYLPPTKIDQCRIVDAIISHGCFIRECSVQHSIVGVRSRLDFGVELTDTIMMGADYYQTESEIAALLSEGKVPVGIGQNSKIRKCIIEMNANIGKDVIIMNKDGVEEADRAEEGFYIRSGIVIVLEKATIKDGKII